MSSPLTVAEVADLERVSEKTIRKEIAAGRLPAYKIGKGYRIDPESLSTWHKAIAVKPKRTNFRGILKAAEGRGNG